MSIRQSDHPGVDNTTTIFYNELENALDTAGIRWNNIPYKHHVQALETVLDNKEVLEDVKRMDEEFAETLEIDNGSDYVSEYVGVVSEMDEQFYGRDHHERCIDALTQEYLEDRPDFDIVLRNVFYEDRHYESPADQDVYSDITLPWHRDLSEREWSDADFMAVDTNRNEIEIHQVKRSDMSEHEKKGRIERVNTVIDDVNEVVDENYSVSWHFHVADEFTMSKHPMPEKFDQQVYTESGLGSFSKYLSEMAVDSAKNSGLDIMTG